MENTDASSGGNSQQQQQPNLPPGFRFHPTDEELVVHYLKKKAASAPLPVAIIAEVDLYKFDPWELPTKATFGEQEWYFFSPRDRKYPNGARPNRAATSGYWKATGTDKPVLSSGGTQKVGVKKALVFYGGKPPKGIKTNWIMHEYRLIDNKVSSKPPGVDLGNKKNSLRLDDWVLCRIYKKNNTHRIMDHDKEHSMDDMMLGCSVPPSLTIGSNQHHKSYFPRGSSLYTNNAAAIANNNANLFQGMLTNDGIDINYGSSLSQFAPSSSGKLELPMKRALQSLYGTTEEDEAGPSNHHHDVNGGGAVARTDGNNNSFVGLLGQLPQTSTMGAHQTATLLEGSSEDGVFRQPYQLPCLNWYS